MPICLPKWLNHFAFPPAKSNTCYSTSLSAFGIVNVLDLTMLIGVWRYLIVVWIFICLIMHHFKCLFAICKYSLMRSMLRTFAQFLIKLFFLLLSFKNSLHFWITSLSHVPSENIFFCILSSQSLEILLESTLFISYWNLFQGLYLWCLFKQASPYPRSSKLSTTLSFKSFKVWDFTFQSN